MASEPDMSEGSIRQHIWDIFHSYDDQDHNIYDNSHNYNIFDYPADIYSGNISLGDIAEEVCLAEVKQGGEVCIWL